MGKRLTAVINKQICNTTNTNRVLSFENLKKCSVLLLRRLDLQFTAKQFDGIITLQITQNNHTKYSKP